MFKISDRLYDVLKWVTLVCIPAFTTAYVGLAAIWGWPYADQVAKTTAVICTLLGALLGISTAQYNKDASGTIYTPATWEDVDDENDNE